MLTNIFQNESLSMLNKMFLVCSITAIWPLFDHMSNIFYNQFDKNIVTVIIG